MLIQFTVGNYLSFKEKVTLSMVKTALHELPENVIQLDYDFQLLKSVVVYGANASGKSNLINALDFMRFFTMSSFKAYQVEEKIGISSFRFSEDTKHNPSFFEIVFVIENITYRYGFEVDNNNVHKEWLFHILKSTEEELFHREGQEFRTSEEFAEGKELGQKTRENCLFLSVVSQFNGEVSSRIIKWFWRLGIGSTQDYRAYYDYALMKMEKDPSLVEAVNRFVSIADNGIESFEIESVNTSNKRLEKSVAQKDNRELKRKLVYFIHKVFNREKQIAGTTKLELNTSESEGAKKMFALSVPILETLKNGEVLVIDELENHLHPLLFKYIIKLFNSYSNRNNAQLIFTTHNLTCMNRECFRRDQIWFTEKNDYGESNLFSLADYKVRNDASYSKDYLLGKYGAVPFINDIDLSFKEKENEPSK